MKIGTTNMTVRWCEFILFESQNYCLLMNMCASCPYEDYTDY